MFFRLLKMTFRSGGFEIRVHFFFCYFSLCVSRFLFSINININIICMFWLAHRRAVMNTPFSKIFRKTYQTQREREREIMFDFSHRLAAIRFGLDFLWPWPNKNVVFRECEKQFIYMFMFIHWGQSLLLCWDSWEFHSGFPTRVSIRKPTVYWRVL